MFGLIKKMFMGLLVNIINAFNHAKCVLLSNQKLEDSTYEYSQEFHYYPFAVKLDKFLGSCNTLNDLFNIVCVTNKTKDLNLSMFNMITVINESKVLTKDISCKSKCGVDGKNHNPD